MNNFNLSDLLTTIPAFIVAIVILVGFHELGHFWVARRLGIRVLRFSIGFGKPLWKRVSAKDGVEYVIGAIPLGGYVKLLGERSDDDQPIAAHDLPYSFQRAPVWKRILVLLAGPAANLLLAILFYWILMLAGTPALKPVIGEVAENSVAAMAGIQSGDLITEVQGVEVSTREDATMQLFTELIEGPVQLVVRGDRGLEKPRTLNITAATHLDLNDPENMFVAVGFEFWQPSDPALIEKVVANGPADRAGLKPGDLILALNGQPIKYYRDLIKLVSPHAGQEVQLTLARSGVERDLPITVGESNVNGRKIGRIGVGIKSSPYPESMIVAQKYGLIPALGHAFGKTRDAVMLDVKSIRLLVSRKIPADNLSGSLGIAEITGEAARHGLITFIGWLAFLSVNLGILNLLPIPVLDGGQVVYQLIELVKGSPVSERIQLIAQQIGIAALIMLVSLTLYNDIARHLS